MQGPDPFPPLTPGEEPESPGCAAWEPEITAALDGKLSPVEATALDEHCRQCPRCAGLLASAREAMEWLTYLDRRPASPADLVDKILARTGEHLQAGLPLEPVRPYSSPELTTGIAFVPAHAGHAGRAGQRMAAQPAHARLFSTVAMAFFSIALTISLVHSNLSRPASPGGGAPTLESAVAEQLGSANELAATYRGHVARARESLIHEAQREIEILKSAAQPLGFGVPSPTPKSASPASRNGGSEQNQGGVAEISQAAMPGPSPQIASRRNPS